MSEKNKVYNLSTEWFDLKKEDWGEKKTETSTRCREIEKEVESITNCDPLTVIWACYISPRIHL